MSTADEFRGDDAAMPVTGDPVVPILDIPPNEDLAPSNGLLAAVTALGEEENARAAEELKNVVAEENDSVEGSSVELVTNSVAVTESVTTSVFVTEFSRASAVKSVDSTGLGLEREAGDGTAATSGEKDGESGPPPSKKVKAAMDGKDHPSVDSAASSTEKSVKLGPKTFTSGVDMFKYFYDLLHAWVSNVDVNKYEFLVLSELISKGHRDAEAKTGSGIQAFQVRFHPGWHSRCYYIIRTDGSVDDFSYRKCVDKIMPLPENLFSPSGDLLVEKLFRPEDDHWSKRSKRKDISVDGWKGQASRGGRGGRGGRRGGGWGGH
jgi:hypothetical protein